MILADIQTVQQTVEGSGYLVNCLLWIFPGNELYPLVETWIASGHTPTPAPVDPLAGAKAEIDRIIAVIPKGVQQITLDDNGEAIIMHNIGSLWYCIFAQPACCSMPNMYIEKTSNSFSILAGKEKSPVIYRIEPLLPPCGSENLIFFEP